MKCLQQYAAMVTKRSSPLSVVHGCLPMIPYSKELHFLVEYLFMLIIINNNKIFYEKMCFFLSYFMLATVL